MNFSTGHSIVDAVGQLHFSGNLIHHSWYQHIRYSNKRGKFTDPWAVNILADIVYWYRPIEVRDEQTGHLIGYRKKFSEDKLQRSPEAFSELFCCSVKVVREALKLLEQLNLIDIELRAIRTDWGVIPTAMFIGLNPDMLKQITHSTSKPETIEKSLLPKSVRRTAEMGKEGCPNGEGGLPKSVRGSAEMGKSSIYIEFTETTQETSHRAASPQKQNSHSVSGENQVEQKIKEEVEAVAVEIEVLPKEDKNEQSNRPHETQEQLASLTKFNSSKDQDSGEARCNNKALQKLVERLENGEITKLPPHELKMLADAVIGDYIAEYRQSGNINSANPNDIRSEFLAYVTENHLSSKLRNSVNAFGRIRNIEQEPTQWRSLVEMVEGWLSKRKTSTFDERNQTPAQKTAEFEDFMAELLSANA